MFQCFWWKQLAVDSCLPPPPDKQQTHYESVSGHYVIKQRCTRLVQCSCADTMCGEIMMSHIYTETHQSASEMQRFLIEGREGMFSLINKLGYERKKMFILRLCGPYRMQWDDQVDGVTETKVKPWSRRWSSRFRSEANEALIVQLMIPFHLNVMADAGACSLRVNWMWIYGIHLVHTDCRLACVLCVCVCAGNYLAEIESSSPSVSDE